MCLITTDPTIHILEEDLIVYKSLIKLDNSQSFISTSQNFLYVKGYLNTNKKLVAVKQIIISGADIANDYYYANYKAHDYYDTKPDCYGVKYGFHVFLKEEDCLSDSYPISTVFSFLIPKGSNIIYDQVGMAVTNQIILL